MTRLAIVAALLLAIAFAPLASRQEGVKVGSKKFTESVLLGELVAQLAEDAGERSLHFRELGGTRIVFQALLDGDLDVYPEYSGTIAEEILNGAEADSLEAMRDLLAKQGVAMGEPLGFNNTYVLAMKESRAAELGIEKISDLARRPELAMGFSNEFMDRQDGWPNLQRHYDLPQRKVNGLDHDLAYRQLDLGEIDVIDAYATDAMPQVYGLRLLEDDLGFFPRYEAVLLYRADLAERKPRVIESLRRLEGAIAGREMAAANRRVEVDRVGESRVAAEMLLEKFGVTIQAVESTMPRRVGRRTLQHLDLVRRSLIPAILLAIPLGVIAAKLPRFGQLLLGVVGVIQTIPSLALLVMLMPVIVALGLSGIGLGSATAVTALLLYSLLPIVRSTHAGLTGVSSEHREAAAALGLTPTRRLFDIELPLASRHILSGIKTAAVLNIGFATLGALIGAGGYGQPIITGIRLNDTSLVLEGAVPAAVMALVAQGIFEISERWLVPQGLRLEAAT